MSATVSYGRDGNIVLICVDNPPVNALSTSVIGGLDLALDALDKESGCSMAVVYCAGSGFIAGADLKEATTVERSNAAAGVINRLARSGTPVLAAIHGNALGGGLETALACDYRCASADARFGLPEVNIGAVPGYGGTQRLPRLVGLETALRLMTSGATLDARQALAAGLIDRIIPDYSRDAVLAYARELEASASPLRKTDQMTVVDAGQAKELCEAALAWSVKERSGEEAPALIVRSARMSAIAPIQEGLEYERTISRSRMDAEQCLAMRSLFFADRQIRKNAGRAAAAQIAGNRMLESMFAVIAGLLAGRMDTARVGRAFRGFGWDPSALPWPEKGTNGAGGNEPLSGAPASIDWDIVYPSLAALEEGGTRALQELPDLQAGDIDSEFCRTWAFPRYRGGPMYFATHDQGYSAFRNQVNAAHMTKEVRR